MQTQAIASSSFQNQKEKVNSWRNAFQEAAKKREEKSEDSMVESVFMLPELSLQEKEALPST